MRWRKQSENEKKKDPDMLVGRIKRKVVVVVVAIIFSTKLFWKQRNQFARSRARESFGRFYQWKKQKSESRKRSLRFDESFAFLVPPKKCLCFFFLLRSSRLVPLLRLGERERDGATRLGQDLINDWLNCLDGFCNWTICRRVRPISRHMCPDWRRFFFYFWLYDSFDILTARRGDLRQRPPIQLLRLLLPDSCHFFTAPLPALVHSYTHTRPAIKNSAAKLSRDFNVSHKLS